MDGLPLGCAHDADVARALIGLPCTRPALGHSRAVSRAVRAGADDSSRRRTQCAGDRARYVASHGGRHRTQLSTTRMGAVSDPHLAEGGDAWTAGISNCLSMGLWRRFV